MLLLSVLVSLLCGQPTALWPFRTAVNAVAVVPPKNDDTKQVAIIGMY